MASETERLIALLETTVNALAAAQAQQAALITHLQVAPAQAAAPQPAVMTPVAPAPAPAASQRTLAQWLDIHVAALQQRGYKAQTLKNRGANLKHVRRIWGSRPIAELRPHEISAGLREFLPKRSSTAQRVLGELREALSEAVANDWATTNVATHVKLPAHKPMRKRLSLDTLLHMCALAQASRQQWLLCMLLLALMTGQRRADLAKMRFDDIVTDEHGARFLRIEQQKEAGKGYGARIEIPLALKLKIVDLSLEQVIDLCRASGKPGPTLLRTAGGRPIELSSLSARFHECIRAVCGAEAYGEHEWPSLHEARSLSARLYKAEGHDVQTLLGHKDAEMTAVYLDDRGLGAKDWKRLVVPSETRAHHPAMHAHLVPGLPVMRGTPSGHDAAQHEHHRSSAGPMGHPA